MDLSLFICGAAGEGVQTIGDVLAHAFLAHGYAVFLTSEFESRIRGGNSSTRLRVAETPTNAPRPDADFLLALNPTALDWYLPTLRDDGMALSPAEDARASHHLALPFTEVARKHAGSERFANAVAAGALSAAVGLPCPQLEETLSATFVSRGQEVVDANTAAARIGYKLALERLGDQLPTMLPPRSDSHVFASAHDVIPLAAAASDCRFISAYPMSPSTGIITAFSRHADLGVFVEQAEDEIAAINMAIGASAAGARAMTATSGGGFALMNEALSLTGMIEIPIVIVIAQRPGPATGLPTRTAQEDLLFAIRAGHGEFPRLVLAPSDPQDAAMKTIRAFDLADRFQIPVILLTDQYLADSFFSLPKLEIPSPVTRSYLADPDQITEYARYALTSDGISPRLALGQSEHLVCLDSDEHTELGHITEDLSVIRPAMVAKRLEKARRLRATIEAPARSNLEDAELILVGWGSTKGAIGEAASHLRKNGHAIGTIHFTEVWPLPEIALPQGPEIFVIEGNATGQFAGLLEQSTATTIAGRIGRSDGTPIDAAFILEALS